MEHLSRSRVDRAGAVLRRHRLQDAVDLDALRVALDDVDRFRREWAQRPWPLTSIDMGLRSMVRTVLDGRARVSQRHKRLSRILDKLTRFPRMRLSQMEDIGGCRVVTQGLVDIEKVRARIRSVWGTSIHSENDYVSRPKPDGYRGLHVIVRRHDHLVEVQLRTSRQHWWATHVETLESALGSPIRELRGEEETVTTLLEVSDQLARVDRGEIVATADAAAITSKLQHLFDRLVGYRP